LCGLLSVTKSSIAQGLTCILPSYFTQAVGQNQIEINGDGPKETDSQTILFDSRDIVEWRNTDDIEPDEI
jgi:hypothetical protein